MQMPRSLSILPAILASGLIVTVTANAAEKSRYQCQSGDIVRRIVIEVGDPSTGLPCEVVYWKDTEAPGVRRVLWNARTDAAYCQQKASSLAEKLNGSGWQCDNAGDGASTDQTALSTPTSPTQPDNGASSTTVPALDAATVGGDSQTPEQSDLSRETTPSLPSETPTTPGLPTPSPSPSDTQTAELTPPSNPLSAEANDQLQSVIAQNLTSLNQQVDGDFKAKVGRFGDLNADGLDDAVVLFNYESSTEDFTQFVAAYLFKGDSYHLAATKPVGGTERAVQEVEVENIVNGSILLKLYLNDASQTEDRRAAMALKDGQLIEIE